MILGRPLGCNALNATQRIVSSSIYSTGQDMGLTQANAAANPRNSGGALVNLRGEVVGVADAKLVSVAIEGVGFAINASTVRAYLDPLIAGETSKS